MILSENTDYKEVDGGYELLRDMHINTCLYGFIAKHKYFEVRLDGLIIGRKGYFWDGATGAIDNKSMLPSSLPHDIGYQALRELLFFNSAEFSWSEHDSIRKEVDKMFIDVCKKSGMWWIRRRYVYRAVRAASWAAAPDTEYLINEILRLRRVTRKTN